MTEREALNRIKKTLFANSNNVRGSLTINRDCEINRNCGRLMQINSHNELTIFNPDETANEPSINEAWGIIRTKVMYDYTLREFLNITE